jgi:hypothetical protein
MRCLECSRLTAEYDRLHLAYKTAFNAMIAGGTVPDSDFPKLRLSADEARLESELARLELERHQQIHYKAN